jgi:hypothetical protein
MSIPVKFLRELRGETSEPLIGELNRLMLEGKSYKKTIVAIQVNSNMVARGLSLIFQISVEPIAWIYVSRKEIPGYIPFSSVELLNQGEWFISNDYYGQEFAVVWKRFSGEDQLTLTRSLAFALEALGAPQRHSWKLEAIYR